MWPLSARGVPLSAASGAPPAAYAAWPYLSAAAVVTLSLPPALSEVVTLVCTATPALLSVSLGPAAPPLSTCGDAPAPSTLCGVVPSQGVAAGGAPGLTIPLSITLPGGASLPAAAAPSAQLSCELRSAFSTVDVADSRLLPRYGSSTVMTLPITVFPVFQPLLASLLLESRGVAGTFRVMGGVDAGTVLPPLRVSTVAPAENGTAPQGWDAAALGTPAGAPLLAPLLAALAPFQNAAVVAAQPPAPVSVTLSTSAHMLLLLAPSSPLPSPTLMVTLNGAPCTVNWVGGGGTVISVTTPPLSQLCSATATDCGTAVLVLRQGSADPLDSLRALLLSSAPARRAAAATATLFFPAAYPPLPLPARPAPLLAALSLPDLLAYARATAPAGTGFRLAEACTDPAYAPAETCSLVGGRAPPPPPPGTVCAYGTGASCTPCPSDRALCPGGNTLLPLPGWWAPLPNSPPGDVVKCPPPSAARCPGWDAAATGARTAVCARGYAGAACGGCARGFFPSQGGCSECPSLTNQLEYLIVPLQFLGGLAALGGALFLVARHALTAQRRGRRPPLCGKRGSLTVVGIFLVWAWGALQTLSALFSQAVADRTVPPALVPVFAAFSALQFQGVTVAPACNPGGDPFSSLWAATGAAYGAVGVGAICVALLYLLHRPAPPSVEAAAAPPPPPPPPPPRHVRAMYFMLSLVVNFFAIGFGALVGTAVNALACFAPTPISVADYAATRGDGSALSALKMTFGALPNMTVLRTAAGDPIFAETAGLTQVLATTVSVPLLAADANTVCGEGAHVRARMAGLSLLVLLAGALPALVLASLLAVGKLKGLKRLFVCKEVEEGAEDSEDAAPKDVERGAQAPSPPPPPAAAQPPNSPARIIVDALWRRDLKARAQWLTAQDWLLTALCTGATTYAGTAATLNAYLAYQISMVVALLGSALLLWRLQPTMERTQWQNTVQVAVFALAGAAACANVALRYYLAPGDVGALALCAILLVLTGCIMMLLFVLWWRMLWSLGARPAPAAAAAAAAVVGPAHLFARESAPPRPTPHARARALARDAAPSGGGGATVATRQPSPVHLTTPKPLALSHKRGGAALIGRQPSLARPRLSSPPERSGVALVVRRPSPPTATARIASTHTTWNPLALNQRPLTPRAPPYPSWTQQSPRSRSRGRR